MSLVDFFFNSNYRESLQRTSTSLDCDDIERISEYQRIRNNNKFQRDYHLKKLQHEVDLLQSEIRYGFINVKLINKEVFTMFLNQYNPLPWTINVLWERFKKYNKIQNEN